MCATIQRLAGIGLILLLSSQVEAQHLFWNLEGQEQATCLYGTVTVLATHPAVYYCAANWHPGEAAGGYCGIQHNSLEERRTIFSVWDTSPQLHPKTTEADSETVFGRFGGEGEGGHTHMLWPWKEGDVFQFFVQKQRGKEFTTDARYYIYDGNDGQWRHCATITSPNGGQGSVTTIGGGLNSFLENFAGKDKDTPKVAIYRLWLGPSVDTMQPLTRAGGDGIWGQLHDSYFLAEGAQDKLNAVFRALEKKYGKPAFAGQGRGLPPLSQKRIPGDVLKALTDLPRADPVREKSDLPAVDKQFVIRSLLSQKPLAIRRGAETKGPALVQDAARKSRIVCRLQKDGDAFLIIDTASGLVFDATSSGEVALKKPDGRGGQTWKFIAAGDAHHIQCTATGQVLDVSGGSTDSGTPIITYSLKDQPSPNQLWMLTEVHTGR